jgi:hypothetical protein
MASNAAPVPQSLAFLADVPPVNTIDDVIAVMEHIDAALPATDGLKWFNLLYLTVTQSVKDKPPQGGWNDFDWISKLDVIFARYYFGAIAASITGSAAVPSAWNALFQCRATANIDRIQFALAGMNAHINHDLPLALVDTRNATQKGSALTSGEHDDFEHVNQLLEGVIPQTLTFLATGIVGLIAQDTGKIGRLLAMWNVAVARDLAWNNADLIQSVTPAARTQIVEVLNKLTGVASRALLLPIA